MVCGIDSRATVMDAARLPDLTSVPYVVAPPPGFTEPELLSGEDKGSLSVPSMVLP